MAIFFGLTKFSQYNFGSKNVTVLTDHKPLISNFTKPLENVTPRLQRMLIQIRKYSFRLEHRPGSELVRVEFTLRRFFMKLLILI